MRLTRWIILAWLVGALSTPVTSYGVVDHSNPDSNAGYEKLHPMSIEYFQQQGK